MILNRFACTALCEQWPAAHPLTHKPKNRLVNSILLVRVIVASNFWRALKAVFQDKWHWPQGSWTIQVSCNNNWITEDGVHVCPFSHPMRNWKPKWSNIALQLLVAKGRFKFGPGHLYLLCLFFFLSVSSLVVEATHGSLDEWARTFAFHQQILSYNAISQ